MCCDCNKESTAKHLYKHIHIHFNGCTHTLAYLITVSSNTRDPLSGKTVICLCAQQCASLVERDSTHTHTHMYKYIDVITLCRDVRTCKLAHTHTQMCNGIESTRQSH